ncbi:PREDICTED: DNA-binding protein RFX2-like isoform X1 [Amphimedon queenslandica]|uniref:RFX-type winged-helix domain-containing protein n=1 Tax=Amphimedon queenslandica TaxID=400682 RepID=A0A1X7V8G2_AMPQE|nr:PREDICTED: DNA-binding protein RFX2-like isoform X1 [Amphimedon queenslandica]XP_019850312.1 PREDICTED: DNA-binding protein RFX2-like isoform X1 [Amphimedon queenslandica]|eukprot:XP_019850311.1 PREDICTED: DNA-binding protein RFX2-like isoform X1 [Amphimedon queenslandica]
MSDHSLHQDLLGQQSSVHDSGDSPSDDSGSPTTEGQLMATPGTQGVQIQVLQQSSDQNIAVQSLLGQEIATAQLAFANLPVTRQQEVLAACQQQLLQSIRSTLPTAQSIVVPSAVQNVTVVATNSSNQPQGRISAQYVTPFNTDVTQVITQPISTTPIAGHVVATTGYDLSQAQSIYSQQIMSGGADRYAGPNSISASTRADPHTIKWLLDNYETAEGVSLPRSTLYNHYLRHCAASKIDAINAASFGKLIRSVFIGLKTRRLGTRGNSKYHYYGIRIKIDSPLNTYPQEDSPSVAMRQPTTASRESSNGDGGSGDGGIDSAANLTPHQQHQQYLGDHRPELDQFPDLDWEGQVALDGTVCSNEDISDFVALYREHCEAILDVVANLQFQMVENLWQAFWVDTSRSSSDIQADDDQDHRLSREKLFVLTSCQPLLDYLVACDHILYQCIVNFLISNVLRPIPATLTQSIRNFAKNLENWMNSCLEGYPVKCVQAKVSSVIAFSQTLRRYTSLNHLAQAARAVLQNASQINQMINDLNRVDFANVQEQAAWVCQCDEALASRLEMDFKNTLQQQNSLEQWAVWLEGVVTTVLQPHEDTPEYPKAARQFLLKWSFYSSMVIRDLTLRSAASFGSFHLIRLLYDEYMFYLIENKVARATGKTPIAVMTEFSAMAKAGFESTAVSTSSLGTANSDLELEPPTKKQRT